MKKVLCAVIAAALVLGVGCVVFAGCDGFGTIWKNVSTFEELTKGYSGSAEYGTSVRLTADIDCEFQTVSPLLLGKSFDGQGHTIKNAVVSSSEYNGLHSSFFELGTNSIKNLTLENITVNGSGRCDAIVIASDCSEIVNVHVKNCKIIANQSIRDARFGCYMGGIYGGDEFDETLSADLLSPTICKITDCSAENLSLKLGKYTGSKVNQSDIRMGGIAGDCRNITNCYAKDCTFTAESSDTACIPYVGGVVGIAQGDLENCYSSNNEFSVNGRGYVICGGLAGFTGQFDTDGKAVSSSVKYCYADGNEITTDSKSAYVGGALGLVRKSAISQCCASNNDISLNGSADKDAKRRVGGFAGALNSNSTLSCFAYNDALLIDSGNNLSKSNSCIAGFVGSVNDSAQFAKCASYVKDGGIEAPAMDEFCASVINDIADCFVSSLTFGNACSCETLDESFWNSPNAIKRNLGLLSSYWKFDKGIPYLDFAD